MYVEVNEIDIIIYREKCFFGGGGHRLHQKLALNL
jgi:hypothetical protein